MHRHWAISFQPKILNYQNEDKWEGDFASRSSFKFPGYLEIAKFEENKSFNQKFLL